MLTSPGSDPRPAPPGDEADTSEVDDTVDVPDQAEPEPDATADDESAALRRELARSQDRYRRALADLDNYRKRMEREGDRRAAQARDAQLREWLEALDSVERALRVTPDDAGLVAVLEQMDAILARHGIERIAQVGEPFDPARHEAVATIPADGDVPDRAIVDVVRSGFGSRDGEILRLAQVAVATRAEDGD